MTEQALRMVDELADLVDELECQLMEWKASRDSMVPLMADLTHCTKRLEARLEYLGKPVRAKVARVKKAGLNGKKSK